MKDTTQKPTEIDLNGFIQYLLELPWLEIGAYVVLLTLAVKLAAHIATKWQQKRDREHLATMTNREFRRARNNAVLGTIDE